MGIKQKETQPVLSEGLARLEAEIDDALAKGLIPVIGPTGKGYDGIV